MPWDVRRRGNKWVVVSKTDGRVFGTHPSEARARDQQKALYANYHKKGQKK